MDPNDCDYQDFIQEKRNNSKENIPNYGGRPTGTTIAKKMDDLFAFMKLKNDITHAYFSAVERSKYDNRRVKYGLLDSIILDFSKHAKIDNCWNDVPYISKDTIRSRVKRGLGLKNVTNNGPDSPLVQLEPVLIKFIKAFNEIRLPLTRSAGLNLARKLIEGTELEERMIKFKK